MEAIQNDQSFFKLNIKRFQGACYILGGFVSYYEDNELIDIWDISPKFSLSSQEVNILERLLLKYHMNLENDLSQISFFYTKAKALIKVRNRCFQLDKARLEEMEPTLKENIEQYASHLFRYIKSYYPQIKTDDLYELCAEIVCLAGYENTSSFTVSHTFREWVKGYQETWPIWLWLN